MRISSDRIVTMGMKEPMELCRVIIVGSLWVSVVLNSYFIINPNKEMLKSTPMIKQRKIRQLKQEIMNMVLKPIPILLKTLLFVSYLLKSRCHHNLKTFDCVASSMSNIKFNDLTYYKSCLLYTSPSPRDKRQSRMPSSA